MDCKEKMKMITDKARKAAAVLNVMDTDKKNAILYVMADALERSRDVIKKANTVDMKKAGDEGKNDAFLDRLRLDDKRINGMCEMLRNVAEFEDPIGIVIDEITRPNGLVIKKTRVPIGVIGIIYESRPNVTADCIALCFKSGNTVILRGGSDSINSNKAIYGILSRAAREKGADDGTFILIEDTNREMVDAMLTATGGIDLIMPRGGETLISEVVAKSTVPVIKHYKGICHVYVDDEADLDMAEEIVYNAKVQRPGVCNAMETMIVHENAAEKFLPRVAAKLRSADVAIKGCSRTREILGQGIQVASDKEYATEWLDLIINIRVVGSMDEAIAHIAKFGSDHSDAIVTNNVQKGEEFTKRVDSSAVYINASTRFTDGGEFGKGAEIGISTDKLHARGPMGLEELTTYKYIIHGTGQVRE